MSNGYVVVLHVMTRGTPGSVLGAFDGSSFSWRSNARRMPPLTPRRNTGHGAVLHMHPRVRGTQHLRSSAHGVLSLDNLSCLNEPMAHLPDGRRRALSTCVLTSGEKHPMMRVCRGLMRGPPESHRSPSCGGSTPREAEQWCVGHAAGRDIPMQEHMDTRSEASGGEALGLVIVHGMTAGLVQDIVVGPHHVTADEPVAFGGSDRGPSPCHDDGVHGLRAVPAHAPTDPERSAGLAAAIRQ